MNHMLKCIAVLICSAVPFFAFAELKKPVEGYGAAKWGASMADARKAIKGKISFDDEKRSIVTRDGEITYRYGFVYKEAASEQAAPQQPQGSQAMPAASGQPIAAPTPVPAKQGEAVTKLFFVITEFPYISLDDIKAKMVAEYGEPTGDTINKSQGSLIWDSGKGVAIVWVDSYEKKPYCRKISYLSKEIAREIKTNLGNEFNKREIDVIKRLVP